jgi:uncharacterized membrane protein YkvA (DUF1232 family)
MTLWFARSHPDTPLSAKVLGCFALAYALSPIDLVPDFIPILGYVDDLLLLPGLVWLAIHLLPEQVLNESRIKAEEWASAAPKRPRSMAGAVFVISFWLVATTALGWWLQRS